MLQCGLVFISIWDYTTTDTAEVLEQTKVIETHTKEAALHSQSLLTVSPVLPSISLQPNAQTPQFTTSPDGVVYHVAAASSR
jgi:hypothetical protein